MSMVIRGTRRLLVVGLVLLASGYAACRGAAKGALAGDWDVYIALSAKPKFGFEGWRRMGFAHFAGSDSGNTGFLRRRSGDPILTVTKVAVNGDSVVLTQDPK